MARANYVKKKFYAAYKHLERAAYDAEKRRLQAELLNLQRWAVENRKRVAIAVEGRDAAGKGGTVTEVRVSPGDSVGSGDIVAVVD